MRRLDYLRDRMIDRGMSRNRDYRRGGRESQEDYRRDYIEDYRDYRNDYRNDYRDYAHERYDYRYDRAADYGSMEKEYREDLEQWIEKLKSKDRFRLSREELIKKAKSMGVRFEEFDELEFLAVYYMLMSDYPNIGNDTHSYLAMAKSFFDDDDIKVSPSDKLCIYFYKIVKGE